jgi:tetratricopeptide (TPR) repeat protein
VFYDLRPRGDLPALQTADRRVAPSEGLPGVSISDDPVSSLLSRRLVIRFDRPIQFRVRAGRGNCCIDVVVPGAGAAVDARAPAAPTLVAEDRFLITLQQSADPNLRMEMPVPAELQAYQLFTARRVVDGRTVYEINLGYFSTRADAERALRVLATRFPQAKVVELTQQPPPAAVAAVREPQPAPAPPAVVPMPAPPPVPVVPVTPPGTPEAAPPPAPSPAPAPAPTVEAPPQPEAAPPTSAEIDQRGRVLLAQARAAMDKGDLEQAVGLFNQLLNLPPNVASQDAQELIGVARARLGDATRARAEFELYLKLYPTGPGAERVRRELERLGAGAPAEQRVRRTAAPVTTFAGSFSQYYFGGRSQITQLREGTPLQGVPVPPTQDPISSVDQRQLQSSLDLNYRHREADSDLRVVFRDVYTKNFLDQTSSFSTRTPNRLNAAYVEYRALPTGFSGKVGRQSPTGDGVLYRFDGARVGYLFVPKFGVNAVAGVPADDLFDAKRRFYGLSFDAENLFDHLSASVYGIQQTIDGETDRRAVGTELRYFDAQTNVFGVFDFDTLFHAVNIASVQGTWQTANNAMTLTFLADRRTAPILATGNALLVPDSTSGTPVIHRTITEYLQTLTISEVRQLAKATTTYVNQEQVGATIQTSPNFQVGATASLTNIGALPQFDPDPGRIPSIPAQPATGNIYSYGLQFISSNLYSERDSHVLSASLLKGATYKGKLFAYNNLSLLAERLQLEPSIKYYRQDNGDGSQITRWTPGLRLSWRMTRSFSVEGDVEYENSKTRQPFDATTGQTPVEKANRVFYFVGYRYDF